MAEKKLALIQWCGGIDDKTYTPGIPIQWIRNFDYEVYRSHDSASTEVYAVEWRDSKKPPKGGWKLYDANVIHVSKRLKVLDDKMKMLEGLVSPYKDIPRSSLDSSASQGRDKDKVKGIGRHSGTKKLISHKPISSTPGNPGMNESKTPNNSGKKKRRVIDSSDNESDATEEVSGIQVLPKSPELKQIHLNSGGRRTGLQNMDVDLDEEQGDANSNHVSPSRMFSNSNAIEDQCDSQSKVASEDDREFTENTNSGDEQAIATPKKVTLENIMKEITSMSKKLTNIEKLLHTGDAETVTAGADARKNFPSKPGTSQPAFKNARFLEDGEFTEGNIEIGEVGSKVFVTDMQWAKATSTTTYTAMTVSLLLASFPLETLLRSNYKGGARKVNKGDADAGPTRQALDEHIIQAIKYSVRHQFPKQFKEGGFGQAINVKLTALRRQKK